MMGFLNAVIFMGVMLPIWATVTIVVVLCAIAVGAFLFILKLGFGIFALLNSIFHFIEHNLNFEDTFSRVLGEFLAELISTLLRLWNLGSLIPEWSWEFARYDHPWIAFFMYISAAPRLC